MSGTLQQIRNEDDFEQLLASADWPVLVDLSATWCGPCKGLTPILVEFAAAQDAIDVVTTALVVPLARRN